MAAAPTCAATADWIDFIDCEHAMSFLTKRRPEFRNIHVRQIVAYRLPVAGMVSILHRISGALLFLSLPLLLWAFEASLATESSYLRVSEIAAIPFVKLVFLALAWALLHHLVAGIRFLLLDAHVGVEKAAARTGALAVYAISLPLTALVALQMFGVF